MRLLAAGAISVSVEDALAGTERETPQFGEPGSPTTPLWEDSRVVALFEPGDNLTGRIADAVADAGIKRPAGTSPRRSRRAGLGATDAIPVRADPHLRTPLDRAFLACRARSDGDQSRTRSRAWPSAPAAIRPRDCAWNGWNRPSSRAITLLDYGCGSGILGIAALKLGAADVLGIDIDKAALTAAADNAARNHVALRLAHSSDALTETFDLVVANILTNPLMLLAPLLTARVKPGGRLALSGVLEAQADQVIAAYAHFLPLHVGAVHEGWVRLEGTC